MKTIGRIVAAMIVVGAALFGGSGTAQARLDDHQSLVDGHGRTLTIEQWDSFLNGVAPLDRNSLTREWFHSGKAGYTVTGPGADDFEGVLELGYQVGFPWSLSVGLNFSYTTANIAFDSPDFGDFDPINGILSLDLIPEFVTPPLFPGVSIRADLTNGPGIQEVATFSVDVNGPSGRVAVSNAHGTVTGAAGGVSLRPYARLISTAGDSVTTFGAPWNMN